MTSHGNNSHDNELLHILHRSLAILEKQAAKHGIDVPLSTEHNLYDVRQRIEEIEKRIQYQRVIIHNYITNNKDFAIKYDNTSISVFYVLNYLRRYFHVNDDIINIVSDIINKEQYSLFNIITNILRQSIDIIKVFSIDSQNFNHLMATIDYANQVKDQIVLIISEIIHELLIMKPINRPFNESDVIESISSKKIIRYETSKTKEESRQLRRRTNEEFIDLLINLGIFTEDDNDDTGKYHTYSENILNFIASYHFIINFELIDIIINSKLNRKRFIYIFDYYYFRRKNEFFTILEILLNNDSKLFITLNDLLKNIYIIDDINILQFLDKFDFLSIKNRIYLDFEIQNSLIQTHSYSLFTRNNKGYYMPNKQVHPLLPLSQVNNSKFNQEVGDLQLNYWCRVQNGFWRLSTDEIKYLSYSFEIARFPITNADYSCFIADNGYDLDKPWWSDEGKQIMTRISVQYDNFIYDDDGVFRVWNYPRYWFHPKYSSPMQPTVGITWYEADAYCKWLTQKGHLENWLEKDEIIRLPTLEEWQRVVHHTDGRFRPWGSIDPIPYPAHIQIETINDNSMGYPCAVGCFPTGASASGVEDLIGNIWEWTQTALIDSDSAFFVVGQSFTECVSVNDELEQQELSTASTNNLGFRIIKVQKDKES